MTDAAVAAATPAPDDAPRSARELALDHLLDSDGPQTVAEIVAGSGVDRNSVDQALHRLIGAEEIERVAKGTYRIAPPKPKAPERVRGGHTDAEWIALVQAWFANPASWNVERDGPPPNDPNHRIPQDLVDRIKQQWEREAKQRTRRHDRVWQTVHLQS
jgi:hypothetical protein